MHSGEHFNSSSDTSDDEDEDGGWLAQSTFDLGRPPLSRRNNGNRQVSSSGSNFDVGTCPLCYVLELIRSPRMLSIPSPVVL